MAQENRQNPASLPARGRRARPRNDEHPVLEWISNYNQYHIDFSPAASSQSLAGQPVSGILEGRFKDGFLLTVRVGTITGPLLRGMVFVPDLSTHSAENDIAPNMPMLNVPPVRVEASTRASLPTPNQPVQQSYVEPLPQYEPATVPTEAQSVQQNIRALNPIQINGPASLCTPVQPVQQKVNDVQPIQRNEHDTQPLQRNGPAALSTLAQSVQQDARFVRPVHGNESTVHAPAQSIQKNIGAVKPLQRNESATIWIPAQTVQQNVSAVQPIQKYEPAVNAPGQFLQQNVRDAQPLQINEPAALCIPTQTMQQSVRAVQPIQRNEPVVHEPTQFVQQKVRELQPLQRNKPEVVPTQAIPVQENVGVVQPIQGNEPVAVLTRAERVKQNLETFNSLPKPVHPVRMKLKSAMPYPRLVPSTYHDCLPYSLLHREKLVLSDAGSILLSTSTPTNSQAISKVTNGNANPSSSAASQPLHSVVRNAQSASGSLLAVVNEEEPPVNIPDLNISIQGGADEPNGSAYLEQKGDSSGNASRRGNTNNILKIDETVCGTPSSRGQLSETRALTPKSKPRQEDSTAVQSNTGIPPAPQAPAFPDDPKGTTPPGFHNAVHRRR